METLLSLLKIDLGITHNLRDTFFIKLIEGALKEVQRRGIKVDLNSADDQMLISDYAAWAYRNRAENIPLAENIKHRLRNRIIKERIDKQNAIL